MQYATDIYLAIEYCLCSMYSSCHNFGNGMEPCLERSVVWDKNGMHIEIVYMV